MDIATTISTLITTFGYPVIFLGEMCEGTGIPIPGEAMLIGAAVYAGVTDHISIIAIIILSTLGAFTGDNIGYQIGKRAGTYLLSKYGHVLFLTEQRMKTLQKYFTGNGGWIVFIGRFTAFFRIFSPLLAGINGMPYLKFAIYNFSGCFLWSLSYGVLGYILGKNLPLLYRILRPVGATLFILVLLALAVSIGYFIYRERRTTI